MKWSLDWDAHPGLLLLTVTGTMTPEAMAALADAVRSDAQSGAVVGTLADYRAVDTTPMTALASRALAADNAQALGEGPRQPVAIVTAPGQAFGLASVFSGHMSGRRPDAPLRVFTSVPEALAWLRDATAPPGPGSGPGPAG